MKIIRVASPVPVTGEGTLTGVYALLKEIGVPITQQDIEVAEKEEPTQAEEVTESIEDEKDHNPPQEELSIELEEGADKSTELEAKENMGNEPVEIEHKKPFNEDCSLDGEYQLSHKLLEISTKMVVKGDKVLFDSEIEQTPSYHNHP